MDRLGQADPVVTVDVGRPADEIGRTHPGGNPEGSITRSMKIMPAMISRLDVMSPLVPLPPAFLSGVVPPAVSSACTRK